MRRLLCIATVLACRPEAAPSPSFVHDAGAAPQPPPIAPGPPDLRVLEIAVGDDHSCARMHDESVRCWGSNDNHQFGYYTTDDFLTPTPLPDLAPARRLALGGTNTCVWRPDGALRCVGLAEYDPVVDNVSRPSRALIDHVFADIAAVSLYSTGRCMLRTDGHVRCFGENRDGELGSGSFDRVARPGEPVGLGPVSRVVSESSHSCARMLDGTVRCWGRNRSGEVGDGTMQPRTTPTAVRGLADVVQVAVGYLRTCAVLGDATVRCWGQHKSGCGGCIDTNPVAVPSLAGVAEVGLGDFHGCARMLDGGVRCWGSHADGQLGDGGSRERTQYCDRHVEREGRRIHEWSPCVVEAVPVAGLQDVAQLAVGRKHACALTGEQRVFCWGENRHGQIGDGTTEARGVPTEPAW